MDGWVDFNMNALVSIVMYLSLYIVGIIYDYIGNS